MRQKKQIGSRILILILGLIYLIPFYILVVMSLKRKDDFTSKWALPSYFTLDNYTNAWKSANIPRAMMNNLIITVGVVALVVVIGAMASYPLARRKTRFNNMLYSLIVSLIVLPSISISANLYKIMIDIKAIDTYWGMILVVASFSLPMVIFLYTGFISTIPRELEDAALIDGCNRFSVFFRIILPLLKNSTITVIIFAGQGAWNDYSFALLYLQSPEKQNMTLTISTFFSEYHLELGWMSAGCIINALPLILVFFCCQKYFIRGLTDGANK
jgi:raffinose/stachyose/melibiose transport system permease protein